MLISLHLALEAGHRNTVCSTCTGVRLHSTPAVPGAAPAAVPGSGVEVGRLPAPDHGAGPYWTVRCVRVRATLLPAAGYCYVTSCYLLSLGYRAALQLRRQSLAHLGLATLLPSCRRCNASPRWQTPLMTC